MPYMPSLLFLGHAPLRNPLSASTPLLPCGPHCSARWVPGKPWSPLDTREWAKLLSGPGITPNNKLDALCDYYALPRGQYHGALEDAHLSRLAAKAMRDQFLRGGEALGPMGKAAAKIGAHAILGGLISKGPHDMETARVAATTAAVDRTSADEEP